jgi:hypothetical protein
MRKKATCLTLGVTILGICLIIFFTAPESNPRLHRLKSKHADEIRAVIEAYNNASASPGFPAPDVKVGIVYEYTDNCSISLVYLYRENVPESNFWVFFKLKRPKDGLWFVEKRQAFQYAYEDRWGLRKLVTQALRLPPKGFSCD